MIEIVDRLARDFAARENWPWVELLETGDTSFGWGRNHIRQHVYEIIRSLREPTEAMIAAAAQEELPLMDFVRVWTAAIDAALRQHIVPAIENVRREEWTRIQEVLQTAKHAAEASPYWNDRDRRTLDHIIETVAQCAPCLYRQ